MNTAPQVQHNTWKNAVAMLMGEPFELPPARTSKTNVMMAGRDKGFDLDELLINAGFGVDTDPMDCQEFDD